MISTEATLRKVALDAIRSVADSAFGIGPENIKEYFLEYHPPESLGAYLSATVKNKKTERAWAVQVTTSDEEIISGAGLHYSRLYELRIRGYYSLVSGDDFNLAVDHARAIRGAIKLLEIRFNETIDEIDGIDPFSAQVGTSPTGRLLIIDIVYNLRSDNPDY